MLLIVAHHYDLEALWLYTNIKQNGKVPVKLLVPEALGLDYNISLNLSDSEIAHSVITWYKPGEETTDKDIQWLINRLSYIDPIIWNRSADKEKHYAANEMNAFFAAFIYSFRCGVTNQVQNGSLYSNMNFLRRGMAFFEKNGIHPHAGLLTQISGGNGDDKISLPYLRFLLFNRKVYQPTDQSNDDEISRIIRDSDFLRAFDMAEFIFTTDSVTNKPVFLSASSVPSLSIYDDLFIKAIINVYKKQLHGTHIWHSQRKSGRAFGESLRIQENPALPVQSA